MRAEQHRRRRLGKREVRSASRARIELSADSERALKQAGSFVRPSFLVVCSAWLGVLAWEFESAFIGL
jgi:hypothetical protein